MKLWEKILYAAGAVLAVAAVSTAPIAGNSGLLWVALAAGALLILLLYLVRNFRRLGEGLRSHQTGFGTNTVFMVVALLFILVMVNVLGNTYSLTFDLTAGQAFTLSSQSIRVLKNLKRPVQILAFLPAGSNQSVVTFLKQYARYSPLIHFQTIDPSQYPGLAAKYGNLNVGDILFLSGQRRSVVPAGVADENTITTAIFNVSSPLKTIYFLTGHGETSLSGVNGLGLSGLSGALKSAGYSVRHLTLLARKAVPANAALLVVADPQVNLLPREVQAIEAYLNHGGKAIFATEPGSGQYLAPILSPWHIRIGSGAVLDPANTLSDPLTPYSPSYPFSPITQGLAASFFPTAAPVFASPQGRYNLQSIVLTSGSAWERPAGSSVSAVPAGAKTSTYSLMDLVTKGNTLFAVVGDTDFMENANNRLGNRQLFLGTVNYLTSSETLNIPSSKVGPVTPPLVLPTFEMNNIFYTTVLFLPLGLLSAGGIMWWVRR